jgi:eukaryotic-like serine/threonine-protein kinase
MGAAGSTLAGRYRLEEVIGRGGMSIVYRATDEVLGRTVAVKVLLSALADQDPTYAARFEREARAAAALASSAVVTVYDTGRDDGSRYIVMEYVAGRSLGEVLRDGRPLELAEALRIGTRVAGALSAAHAAGILHRDIKPANVMVVRDGTVKVLDFGIARRLDGTSLTQAASVVGTAAYMAPERALGQPGDARSDVYALGCLLYAMLTGSPPFTGEVSAVILHEQINRPPRPPSEVRSGIPPGLDALVLGMLAKSPDVRPQTAGEVRDRLLEPLEVAASVPGGDVTAATEALAGTAATAPLARTQATARLAGVAPAARLADHRWRAVVMGLATAAVTLAAIAVFAGGGTAQHRASSTTRAARPRTTSPAPAKVITTPAQAVTHNAPQPPNAKPGPPPRPPGGPGPGAGGAPPGHGGEPPGQAKKHGPPGGG